MIGWAKPTPVMAQSLRGGSLGWAIVAVAGPLSNLFLAVVAAAWRDRVLKRVEQRARAMQLDSIFVLTTRTKHWFLKRGFVQADPDKLPEARRRMYNWDRKSLVLVKKLV